MDEAEIEHPVGFVEDEDLDLDETVGAAVHQVEQPARRGDQNVDAAREPRCCAPSGTPPNTTAVGSGEPRP